MFPSFGSNSLPVERVVFFFNHLKAIEYKHVRAVHRRVFAMVHGDVIPMGVGAGSEQPMTTNTNKALTS